MRKLCVLLLCLCLLAGCAENSPAETTAPTQTTVPAETRAPLSPEAQALFDKYQDLQNTADTSWRIPTVAELQKSYWYYDGYNDAGSFVTYQLRLQEETLDVNWQIGDEKNTYDKARWSLEIQEDACVLTVDLKDLAGARTYNVLYNPDFEMLYVGIAFDRENLQPEDEPQFRFLMRRVSFAPTDMVGSWERTHTGAEDDKTETPAGECKLSITGLEDAGFCLQYTNQADPEGNISSAPMQLQIPMDMECFAYCDWVAAVEAKGIVRYVALPENDVLLVVSCSAADAQVIDYEWFTRK